MKKLRFFSLVACAMLFASTIYAQAYSGGSGTKEDPYQLANTDDWYAFMQACKKEAYSRGKHFTQIGDIDLSGISTPIHYFSGNYDGQGHTLRGASISSSFTTSAWPEWGLFCSIELEEDGYFRNVVLEDFNMTFSYLSTVGRHYGILAGRIECPPSASVSNVQVNRSSLRFNVWGTYGKFGAIAGYMKGGKLEGCKVLDAQILFERSPYAECGLLLGRSERVSIARCTAQGGTIMLPNGGSVSAYNSSIGGLIGYTQMTSIAECTASSSINGQADASKVNFIIGGLVGTVEGGKISQSVAMPSIAVPQEAQIAGGFIGQASMETPLVIEDCYTHRQEGQSISIGKGKQAGFIGQLTCSDAQNAEHKIARCFSYSQLVDEAGTAQSAPFAHFVEQGNKVASNHLRACYYDPSTNPTLESNPPSIGSTTLHEWYTILDALFTSATPVWQLHPLVAGGQPQPQLAWWLRTQDITAAPLPMPFAGDGTAANPFALANYEQLYTLSRSVNLWNKGMHFRQTANIDAAPSASAGTPFTHGELTLHPGIPPLGDMETSPWNGSYDGGGFAITNLHIARPTNDHVGLFGYVLGHNALSIRNTRIEQATIYGKSHVGTLIGLIDAPNAEIADCLVKVKRVEGANGGIGGLIGTLSRANRIERCAVSSTMRGGLYTAEGSSEVEGIGGFIGVCSNPLPILQCASNLPLAVPSEASYVGGFGGKLQALVHDSYSHGNVLFRTGSPSRETIGGFCGALEHGSIERSYAIGRLIEQSNGEAQATIRTKGFVGNTLDGSLAHTYYENDGGITNTTLDALDQCEGISSRELKSGRYPKGFTDTWHTLRGAYPALTAIDGWRVAYDVNGEGGSISVSAYNGEPVLSGEKIVSHAELTISVIPKEGYKLATLKDGNNLLTQQRLESFTMPYTLVADANLVATFEPASQPGPTCRVLYSTTGEGTLQAALEGEPVSHGQYIKVGSTLSITATPAHGYKLLELQAGEKALHGESDVPITIQHAVEGDILLSARFASLPPPPPEPQPEPQPQPGPTPDPAKLYSVNYASPTEQGTLSVEHNGAPLAAGSKVQEGASIRIIAKPIDPSTHRISSLIINGTERLGESVDGILELAVSSDIHISAAFAAIPIPEQRVKVLFTQEGVGGTLTLYSDGHEIASGADIPVNADVEIIITLSDRYLLRTLVINQDTVKEYAESTFTHRIKASRDLDISATFQAVGETPTPLPSEVEIDTFAKVRIYPNPCTEVLHVSGAAHISHFSVIASDGRPVGSHLGNGSELEPLHVRDLPSGVYLLRLEAQNGAVLLWQFVKR